MKRVSRILRIIAFWADMIAKHLAAKQRKAKPATSSKPIVPKKTKTVRKRKKAKKP